MSYWIALLICVTANIGANLSLKKAVTQLPTSPRLADVPAMLLQPLLWVGLGFAGVVLLAYLYAIRAVPLGVAYPFVTTLAMVGLALTGSIMFDEPLTFKLAVGLVLSITGILIIVTA